MKSIPPYIRFSLLFLCLVFLGATFLINIKSLPKEVQGVVGTLNINTTTPGTTQFPGGAWTSSGNVGIGTTGPGYKLEVNGNGKVGGLVMQASDPGNVPALWTNTSAVYLQSVTGDWATADYTRGNGLLVGGGGGTGALTIAGLFTGNGSGNNYFAGNVGIGTTGPGYKLDVNGTGNFATSLTVAGTTGGVVPSGMIAFFNLTACPSGWTAVTAAAGRTVVGRAANESIGSTVGTALSSLEDRTHTHTGPSHQHLMGLGQNGPNPNLSSTTTGLYGSSGTFTADNGAVSNQGGAVNVPNYLTSTAGTGTTGTASTSNVIPYIQYLVCSKN